MRTQSILTVLALGAAVLAVSCQKRVLEEEPLVTESRTFTCVIASPDTKVAVTDAGKATWEVGDEILVHGAGSSNRKVVTLTADDISADGKSATITVEGITPYDRYGDKGYTSTFYACYPASAVVSGNLYYYARFSETNHLLMAAYNMEDTFVFYNLCGVISFKVSGDFDTFVFAGNNEETVGYSHYQVQLAATEGDPVLNFHKTSDPGTSGPLTTITGSVAADGTTVHYLCLPNGADLTKGFTFKFKKDGAITKIASTATPVNVARGRILPLGDITSRLETYVPPAISDHKSDIPVAGAIDLSAQGTANSYIVTAPGIYKFPAMKGNSQESAGNVFGADLLWETCNGTEVVTKNSVVKAVDFEDNWIYIEMPETLTPGNAVIAAKDVNDQIIWSWHLWIPETTIGLITDGNFIGAQIMDRNLGALDKATAAAAGLGTYGMYYQWGRKDPFPGKAVSTGSFSKADGPLSTEYTIQNPTVYVKVGENDSAGNWNTEDLSDLWKNEDGTKGLYDPCPPGYKVPAYDATYLMWLNDNEGWTYNWDANNYLCGNNVFPMAGWLSGGPTLSYEGARSIILSSTAHSAPRARLKIIRKDKGGFYYGNYFKVEAASVRCVSETALEPQPFVNAEGTPVMGDYQKIVVGDAAELSGLCLSADNSFLWGVGDGGTLYRIGFDGTITTQYSHSADMEGITLDPATGDLYVAVERDQVVAKIAAPGYNSYQVAFTVQEAVDGQYGNSGLEGIAYYKDGQVYVGAQHNATLWTYKLDGTKVAKKTLLALARVGGIEEVGGLFYDATTDWLWVTDSEAHKLFVFKGDVSELLAVYDVSFISNAESVCVDHAHGCVWVGSDDSTSKIYKIDFT